jgi:hypothetical protein
MRRGVPQSIAEELVGHAANTVHGSVYLHKERSTDFTAAGGD